MSDQDKIIEMQREYYQDLYTSDGNVEFKLDIQPQHTVEDYMTASNEEQFSIDEFQEALKSLKNGSCPGSDGIPTEFYKVFWNQNKNDNV